MQEGAQVGSYRVLGQIGQGGMGSVWLAEHVTLGRRAALKVLHPEFSVRAEIVQRFFNEARAATSIQDPGIVQIFDFGQDANGSAYIVMELLEGEPLDVRLKRQGALGIPDALRIMRQVASSLGAAHARGIVHRDLKPENIYLVRDPEVVGGERAKVLDFGIAKLVGQNTGTQTSAVMGTPTYMSPEQCRGAGQVDHRSDVYALGCVLFHLLAGRPPFDAAGGGEIIAMHLREMPQPPSTLRPDIPREVDQLVMQCLQKDPAHRFASGAELAVAIGGLIGSAPRIETGPVFAVPTAPIRAAAKPTTLSSATGASRVTSIPKSRVAVIAGVAVAVGVAGIGGFVAVSSRKPSKPTAAETKQPVGSATAEVKTNVAAAPADPNADVKRRIADVLTKFATWSHDHAGAACPDLATLGVTGDDGWGHPLRITCTDQPADQIIGVTSLGPDGQMGTDDDVASWQLGKEVTSSVRGARWVTVAPETKTDTAKTDTKTASTTKIDTAKTDTTKTDTKTASATKTDTAKTDTKTKTAATKTDTKTAATKTDTKTAATKTDTAKTTSKTHKTTKTGDSKTDKGPKIELDENGLPISR